MSKYVRKSIKSLRHKRRNRLEARSKNPEEFMVRYCKEKRSLEQAQPGNSKTSQASTVDMRRRVFVSMWGFFHSWKQTPTSILANCVVILPLKREWIDKAVPHSRRLHEYLSSKSPLLSKLPDNSDCRDFIKLLKWKDAQGLVCWMHDVTERASGENSLVHPVWHYLNSVLTRLYDPVSGGTYNPVCLDVEWWKRNVEFDIELSNIATELYCAPLQFASLCTMIQRCNPESLVPINTFNSTRRYTYPEVAMRQSGRSNGSSRTSVSDESAGIDMDDANWVIMSDYLSSEDDRDEEEQ